MSMTRYESVAKSIEESLSLPLPPIAVSLVDAVPDGVPSFDGSVPAGCVFWQRAADGPFATATNDHELCSIGVHTHNLASPAASQMSELQTTLGVMADLNYVTKEDVARIPVLARSPRHVVYAPLASAPVDPDVVLLFADSAQGLVITEAVQAVAPELPPALGRPARRGR